MSKPQSDRPDDGGKRERPEWLRWSGVGFEFAGAVAGFALIGWWLDGRYGWSPWGVVIGAALGLIGGTYNLIRQSLMAFKDADRERKLKFGAAESERGQQQQRVEGRRREARPAPEDQAPMDHAPSDQSQGDQQQGGQQQGDQGRRENQET